jgi:hypothetical protein
MAFGAEKLLNPISNAGKTQFHDEAKAD